MIKSIRVESLRGIRSGVLEGFSPLTVLVGANGCGKSTILDALLIGGSGAPGDAVARAIVRRVELQGGARWLFWRGGRSPEPVVHILLERDGPARDVSLRLLPDISEENEQKLVGKRARGPYVEVEAVLKSDGLEMVALTAISYDNVYAFRQHGPRELKEIAPVRFIDPRPGSTHQSLSRSYTDAVEAGRLEEVEALVADIVPSFTHIHNLTDDAGSGLVHLAFPDHSVPVALAGDGIQTLVHVCFALAQAPGSTVLLEEPEANQHPRSIYQTAKAIAAAARRGVQVVLSTHSLELIDDLILELEGDLSPLTVHHLALRAGELKSARYTGPEAALARDSIGEDLR